MATRMEKERQKHQQEKFQAALANLLKDDDNKYCVDCDAKGPRWASWNLGIFLCIRCAGIHRNLGVHISKVKSVNLDAWTAEQVSMMMEVGNSRARAAYEANIPDNFRRPQTDSSLEAFIRAKYEQKKYMAREWVPPKPCIPKEFEIEDKADRKKSRPKQQSSIHIEAPKATVQKSQPVDKKPQTTIKDTTQQTQQSSNTTDLLSLNTSPAKQPVNTQSTDLLGDLVDLVTNQPNEMTITSNQPSDQDSGAQIQNGGLEAALFDDGIAKSQEKSTKDSILALYGSGGGNQSQQQVYGIPGGMYMPQQQNIGMYGGGMGVMPQQQQHQQQMMTNGVQYNPQAMQMQQNPGMYGMMGQQNAGVQSNYGMCNQQQLNAMQYSQMQQQMNNMRLNSGNMVGQQVGPSVGSMNNWGGQVNSGQTLSTNLWQ